MPDGFEKREAALKDKVQNRLVPDTQTTVSIERGRPPFVTGATAREVAKKAQDIHAEMDRKPALTDMTGGAADAGFASRSGKAVVLESIGLAGAGYHARDECSDADTIVPRLPPRPPRAGRPHSACRLQIACMSSSSLACASSASICACSAADSASSACRLASRVSDSGDSPSA